MFYVGVQEAQHYSLKASYSFLFVVTCGPTLTDSGCFFFQPSKMFPPLSTSMLLIYDANAILNYAKVIQPAETKISMNEGRMFWFSVTVCSLLIKSLD